MVPPPPNIGPPLGGFAVASWGFSTWRGRDLRLGELWVPPPLRGGCPPHPTEPPPPKEPPPAP